MAEPRGPFTTSAEDRARFLTDEELDFQLHFENPARDLIDELTQSSVLFRAGKQRIERRTVHRPHHKPHETALAVHVATNPRLVPEAVVGLPKRRRWSSGRRTLRGKMSTTLTGSPGKTRERAASSAARPRGRRASTRARPASPPARAQRWNGAARAP